MLQETRVYDYMVRSGNLVCKLNGATESLPISIGVLPRKKDNSVMAYCVLSSENGGLRVQAFIENDTGLHVEIVSCELETTIHLPSQTHVFCNGYQSWSSSQMISLSNGLPKPPIFQPALHSKAGDYKFSQYSNRKSHSWTYTYFNAPTGFTLLGSLDESLAYTRFDFVHNDSRTGASVIAAKDCEGLFLPPVQRTSGLDVPPVKIFDFFMTTALEDDCFGRYFSLFYKSNRDAGLFNRSRPALAWDSWYALFNQIEENRLLAILWEYKVREIPLDYFIIGQGYEVQAGDWTTHSSSFPGGLPRVIKAISEAGYKPGITLSPFICSSKSQIFRERLELMARDNKGRLIKVGKSHDQGGSLYLLDLYNPQVINHIKRTIKTMTIEWKVALLKMDYLFAAGLNRGAHSKRTRAQAMNHALMILREATGSVPVIACGVPLGSAFGLFEYCSVASDLSSGWNGPNPVFVSKNSRERESTLSAIKSSINRRHLDGRAFSCDPGSFSLRKHKNKLSVEEQESLYKTCIIFGGLISNSDSIGTYGADALNLYRNAISHKATRFNDKRVLSVETTDKGYHVRYALRNELLEADIDTFE